jgi:hypothetical protein
MIKPTVEEGAERSAPRLRKWTPPQVSQWPLEVTKTGQGIVSDGPATVNPT